MFSRIAVLGTGLVGGSIALALRRSFPEARIVGWDKPEVLQQALARGAIHEAVRTLEVAVRDAELVYAALPIGVTLNLLPTVARYCAPNSLVTDACSTKGVVCRMAAAHFTASARFLGGHPMAGKERGGIENADADLFRGAKYALVAEESDADARVKDFAAVVRSLGAQPVWLDADAHDRAVAMLSHLPQLLAVALAGTVDAQTGEKGSPLDLTGSGLRDMLRLAGSPYGTWRDICLTNREQISAAIDQLIQALDDVRLQLTSPELRDTFARANRLYETLRKLQ
jgi:prephenate dehydrogenase